MTATPALLAAAAGVAVGHAALPDHWVPLAVLARTRQYGLGRVARLSGAAAVTHVAISILLGGAVIVIGLQFRGAVEGAQNLVIGALLVSTGLIFAAFELTGRGHHHAHPHLDHEHGDAADGHRHEHPGAATPVDGANRRAGLAAVVVPFGAAASPDLTILPVFVAATAAGVLASIATLVVFSIVTITTIVGLTLSATVGGYQIRGAWLDRWGNTAPAVALIVVGTLVLIGLI